MAIEITTSSPETFDADVLHAERPVLVDFYAEWCAPCKAIAPLVADLARRYGDRLDVRKIDVDQSPSLAKLFGIRGIPTLILFKDGEIADSIVGVTSSQRLESLVHAHTRND